MRSPSLVQRSGVSTILLDSDPGPVGKDLSNQHGTGSLDPVPSNLNRLTILYGEGKLLWDCLSQESEYYRDTFEQTPPEVVESEAKLYDLGAISQKARYRQGKPPVVPADFTKRNAAVGLLKEEKEVYRSPHTDDLYSTLIARFSRNDRLFFLGRIDRAQSWTPNTGAIEWGSYVHERNVIREPERLQDLNMYIYRTFTKGGGRPKNCDGKMSTPYSAIFYIYSKDPVKGLKEAC